jgi:hypothetical protein
MEPGTVVAPLVKAFEETRSPLEYTVFFGVVAVLFVGVFLFGKFILPLLNKARKTEEKPK